MSFLWLLSASWGKGRGWVTGGLARIWCPCLGSSLSIWRAGTLSPQTPFIPPELEILDKFWPSAHKKYTHWQHARCILFFLFLWCCECRLSILKTTFSFFQTEMNFSRTATYYVHLARYVWRKFKQWLISPRWSTQTHKHTLSASFQTLEDLTQWTPVKLSEHETAQKANNCDFLCFRSGGDASEASPRGKNITKKIF